jgi:hypothetical protein
MYVCRQITSDYHLLYVVRLDTSTVHVYGGTGCSQKTFGMQKYVLYIVQATCPKKNRTVVAICNLKEAFARSLFLPEM